MKKSLIDLVPARNIDPKSWMREAETQKIMHLLNPDGLQTMFVGGCVRNTLLSQKVEDIDLATQLTPDKVTSLLEDASVKVIPTGLDHGTVTAVIDGKAFEITTLRQDVETDGRHAVIRFSESWEEDARRRDFTINALYMDMNGGVYDPLDQGLADIESQTFVFVGDAEQRIKEDYLRILRYFRFHALYGKGDMDTHALDACRKHAGRVEGLSRERITQEFLKILAVTEPVPILKVVFDHGVLQRMTMIDQNYTLLRHLCHFQANYGLSALPPRLWLLADQSSEKLSDIQNFLLLPKVFLKDIENMIQVLNLPNLDHEFAVKKAIYMFGRVATAQALMMELAQDRVMNGYAPEAIEHIQSWDVPSLPVKGSDLISAGFKQGPELGQALNKIESLWIESAFSLSKNQLLKQL